MVTMSQRGELDTVSCMEISSTQADFRCDAGVVETTPYCKKTSASLTAPPAMGDTSRTTMFSGRPVSP
jgi:hypothetical protein